MSRNGDDSSDRSEPLGGIDAGGWEALAAEHGRLPTQDAPWAIAAESALSARPRFSICGEPARPAAIAPLAVSGRRLSLAGANEAVEPSDFLASSPEALAILVEGVLRERRPLALERMPADSPAIAAIREAAGRRDVIRHSETTGHPFIALDEAWQEPGGGLSSSRRSSLRRARRRAEKLGEVRIELLEPTPQELGPLLERALVVESRSWKSANGTALLQMPEMAAFFRRLAAEHAARGSLRMDFLHIGEQPVAMQLGVEWQRRLWLFKIGYDDSYAAASPGQILLAESVAAAAGKGLVAYELLGSPAGWTEIWTRELHRCARTMVFPASGPGFVSLGAATADRLLGRRLRTAGSRRLRALERSAARRYVAGPDLADAIDAERRYASAGYATTIGRWGKPGGPPGEAVTEAREAIALLPPGSELSLKFVSVGGDSPELDRLAIECAARGLTLHFDAMAIDRADETLAAAIRLHDLAPGAIGCTLPGRWPRSVADAATAVEESLRVRVVKGEWVDPESPEHDPADGFLSVVETLAGRAAHVEVATQQTSLAAAALERLADAGTSSELQVLHGRRCRAVISRARRLGVPVRIYIPYGLGHLPYSLADIERHPGAALRLIRDLALPYPAPSGVRSPRRSRARRRRAPSPQDT